MTFCCYPFSLSQYKVSGDTESREYKERRGSVSIPIGLKGRRKKMVVTGLAFPSRILLLMRIQESSHCFLPASGFFFPGGNIMAG
jgi:hypothetical protein